MTVSGSSSLDPLSARFAGASDLQTVEQTLGGRGDLGDGLIEDHLIVGCRLGESGDLAHELTSGGSAYWYRSALGGTASALATLGLLAIHVNARLVAILWVLMFLGLVVLSSRKIMHVLLHLAGKLVSEKTTGHQTS